MLVRCISGQFLDTQHTHGHTHTHTHIHNPKVSATNRGQKLNTNFFFVKLFEPPPGYLSKNPEKSRQKAWFTWVLRDIPNGPPTPSRGRPEDIRTKEFGFALLFLASTKKHFQGNYVSEFIHPVFCCQKGIAWRALD